MADETSTAAPAATAEAPIPETSDVSSLFSEALRGIDKQAYETVTAKETKKEPEATQETTKEATTEEATTEATSTEETTEEASEETTDAAAEEAAPSNDPKAQAKWSELKKTVKELKAETERLKAEAQSAKEAKEALDRIKSEHESLQKEREEIDKELYLSRVEATREYKKAVTEPLEGTFKQVEAVAGQFKLDANALVDALYKDISGDTTALDEVISEVPERHKAKIYSLADNLLQIENRRADLKENAKAAYTTAIEKEKAEREQFITQQKETRTKEINTLKTKFQEKFTPILGDKANIDFEAAGRDVMNIEEWDDQTKMYSGYAAVVLPELVKAHETLAAELKEARAQLAKLRNGSPKSSQGVASTPAEAQAKVDYSKTTVENFAKEAADRIARSLQG